MVFGQHDLLLLAPFGAQVAALATGVLDPLPLRGAVGAAMPTVRG
jgi:hypothetical protein